MKVLKTIGKALAFSALMTGTAVSVEARELTTLQGHVTLMNQPVSGSSITLWQTGGGQNPIQLKTVRSNKSGAFSVKLRAQQGVIH